MTLQFDVFFKEKIEARLLEIWEGTIINKVEVFKARKIWRLHLLAPQPISVIDIKKTAEQLCSGHEYLEDIEFNIELKDMGASMRHIIEVRRDDLSSCLVLAGKFLPDMPLIKWEFDKSRIDIISSDDALYKDIIASEICSHLAEWMWQQYAVQVLVRVIYQGKKQYRDKTDNNLIADRQLEIIELGHDIAGSGKRAVNFREGKKMEQTIKAKPLPVADLEEGMKTAVTEGEIWHKEIHNLKDGRLSVCYYLTDYNDSILIRAFVDKEDDDRIKVGDRIRVKGSVRFDNRLKEIALFLEQYMQQDSNCRRDDNENKRIELHAHTKMSAMDGVAEVKELIHKAIMWGHPAIAITDHGCIQSFPQAHAAAQEYNKSGNRIKIIYGVEGYLVEENKKEKPHHIILLARNLTGLKNLYKLISISYLDHFYRQPRMPRQELQQYREGLLLGTACEAGELFRGILAGASDAE
ncbi:MAG: PHP domain-containing protein, partial [Syntrophomonas sp.]|nr:PHP domain-containing protein [Syntrophomonas sp.]